MRTIVFKFQEFWPFYLGEHRNPLNRRLHYMRTGLVLVTLITALVLKRYLLLVALPLLGYGFAWFGLLSRTQSSATFTYPVWSLCADFKMFFYACLGRILQQMIHYYGSAHPPANAPRVDREYVSFRL